MPRWANQPPSPYIYYGTLFRGASDSGRFFAVAGGRGAAPLGEGAAQKNREFLNLGNCFSDFGILGFLDFDFGISILGFLSFGFWDFWSVEIGPFLAGDI